MTRRKIVRPRTTAPVVYRDKSRAGCWRGYVVRDGKRVYRRGSSKAAVLDALAGQVTTSPETALAGRMTIRALADRWIQSIEHSRASNTVEYYRAALAHVDQLTPYLIQDVTTGAIMDAITAVGTSARREDVYVALKALFASAVRWGFLRENPIDRIDRPKHAAKAPQPFQVDEVARILQAAGGSRYHGAIVLGMTLGPRPGELFGLQWIDWDSDRGVLQIRRQASESSGTVTIKEPKTRAGVRSLLLPASVQTALQSRRAEAMKEGNAGSPWIWPSRRGEVTRRSNWVHRHWNKILQSAEVDRRGPHQMRHTAATVLLNGGVPITLVSRILGHSKPSTTLDVYGHLMTTDQGRAVEFLNRKA